MPIRDSRNFSKEKFFSGEADSYTDPDQLAQYKAIRGGEPNVIQVIQDNPEFAAFLAVPLRGDFGMPVHVESALKYNKPDLYNFVYKHWPRCFDLEVVDMGWWEKNGSTAGYEGHKAYIMLKRLSDGEKFNFKVDSVGKDGEYCSLPDDFNMKTWWNKNEALTDFAEEFDLYDSLWDEETAEGVETPVEEV